MRPTSPVWPTPPGRVVVASPHHCLAWAAADLEPEVQAVGISERVRAGRRGPNAETAMPSSIPVRSLPVVVGRFPAVPECSMASGTQPCDQTVCRYHLSHRGRWTHDLKPTRECALEVANEGPHTLEEIAAAFGMKRQSVFKIECAALRKLRERLANGDVELIDTSTIKQRAIELGRAHAKALGQSYAATFGDSLSGDVARLAILRDLRREFPTVGQHFLNRAVKEVLTP